MHKLIGILGSYAKGDGVYSRKLSEGLVSKQSLGLTCRSDSELLRRISSLADDLYENCEALKAKLDTIPGNENDAAQYNRNVIIPAMDSIRNAADALETLTDKSLWPFPTYADLLYY